MHIQYPYLPTGRTILYVPVDHPFILTAKVHAKEFSLDRVMPTSSVVVKDGSVIIGQASNGSDYHEKQPCQRVKLGIPTGRGYELCEGCHPKNHSESRAIQDAIRQGHDPSGADLYLWGHWWCCQSCWEAMIKTGIRHVYLMERSEILFNKLHPENIVGRQFDV